MAKVTGPLFSVSASGKIGDAMVHFGWKGINVVRGYVKPANPKSLLQGNVRTVIGGIGRAVGKIQKDKAFAVAFASLAVIPTGQTKQSFLVKFIKDTYCSDKVAYEAIKTALGSHTASSAFASAGTGIGIASFSLPYSDVTAFTPGLGLYLIAKAAIALGMPGAPYSTPLASWTSTEIGLMVTGMTTVA